MPKRITIHEEDYERLSKMSREDAGLVLHNLLHTLKGEPVELKGDEYIDYFSENACQKMLRFIDASERKSHAGKMGGGQFGNSNARKTSRKRAENEQKTSKKRTENEPNTNTNTNTNTNNKRLYGECENVLLSDEEYQKVKDQGLEGLIEELSLYIAGTGKKYKSHYAVIRQWANRRKKEAKVIKETPFNTGYSRRADDDYDLAKLIKN